MVDFPKNNNAVPILCELPFDASRQSIVVVQGFHGPRGHNQEKVSPFKNLSHAVDFGLPIGSVVKAMRDGIVCAMNLASRDYYAGDDEKVLQQRPVESNLIAVDHGDETWDLYVHLLCDSARVQLHERVFKGQQLALTGMSGWVGDIPNLHVHVQQYIRNNGRLQIETLPIRFRGYDGPLEHSELAASRGG